MMQIFVFPLILMVALILWFAGQPRRPVADPRAAPGRPGRAMSQGDALKLLGLNPSADPNAIHTAYRRLMIRYHPDHGGSHLAAAKLNQAREVLLRRG